MSGSSLTGPEKENKSVVHEDNGDDYARAPVTTSIRLNDVDIESDLMLSSDSDGLNGSELNIATTTEDEELRHMQPEFIELSVLSSPRNRSRTDQITYRSHHPTRQQNGDRNSVQPSPRSVVISFESEVDPENDLTTNQQSSDLPSERMFRPREFFVRSHATASTTRETTADTEDDIRLPSNKRTVKTKKKKSRRSSASETDTVDTALGATASKRAHTPRRSTRRASDSRHRPPDHAETRIIFAPFPFAILSDNRVGKDYEQLRKAIALSDVHVVSDDEDEGDVDEDNANENEYDEDDDHEDEESVASTCTSGQVTQQISTHIHPPTSPSASSSSSSSVSMATCRICFQPEEDDSHEYRLVSPCLCEGTVKYLHQFCLNRWIAESGTPSCELCGYQFHLRTKSMRNIFNWRPIELSQWERVHLSLGLFSLLFVVISLCYMVWVTISADPQAIYTRESMTSEILFPIYACLDALTLCVCSYELSSTVKRLWRRWRATNSCLIVLDKPVRRRRVTVRRPEGDQESDQPIHSNDTIVTEERTGDNVQVHVGLETIDDDDAGNKHSSLKLLGSVGPDQVASDNCSVTLSVTNHDPLTSNSNLDMVRDDIVSFDEVYVEHLNRETRV